MTNDQIYGSQFTADTSRGPSASIWKACPIDRIDSNPGVGIYLFDDFTTFPHITTPTITTEAAIGGKLGYKAFGSSGGTLLSGGSEFGDVVLTETTDNEGVGLATIATPFKIIRGGNSFCFEARIKCGTITDNDGGIFLGMIDSCTLSATVPIAAAGTLADENFVGFHRLEADGDQFDTVYKADGQTQVTAQEDVLSTAMAVSTYLKLGMYFNSTNHEFSWWVNGVKLATTYTLVTTAGNPFPNDVTLGLVLAQLGGSAAGDVVTTMDWWGAASWSLSA